MTHYVFFLLLSLIVGVVSPTLTDQQSNSENRILSGILEDGRRFMKVIPSANDPDSGLLKFSLQRKRPYDDFSTLLCDPSWRRQALRVFEKKKTMAETQFNAVLSWFPNFGSKRITDVYGDDAPFAKGYLRFLPNNLYQLEGKMREMLEQTEMKQVAYLRALFKGFSSLRSVRYLFTSFKKFSHVGHVVRYNKVQKDISFQVPYQRYLDDASINAEEDKALTQLSSLLGDPTLKVKVDHDIQKAAREVKTKRVLELIKTNMPAAKLLERHIKKLEVIQKLKEYVKLQVEYQLAWLQHDFIKRWNNACIPGASDKLRTIV